MPFAKEIGIEIEAGRQQTADVHPSGGAEDMNPFWLIRYTLPLACSKPKIWLGLA